jgi:arginyl-tRNA synthetase
MQVVAAELVLMFLLPGMKTRTGEVVFLTDILDEAQRVMLEQMKGAETSFQLFSFLLNGF